MKNEHYKHYLLTASHYYDSVPHFVLGEQLEASTGFSSLYAVSKADAEAIHEAGTTKGFKGVVWNERLWMDFDSYEAGSRAQGKLEELGYDFVAYDSGGRGVHFGVARECSPSHLLPQRDKQWVQEHFPEADNSIYTHLHLFRLPATPHSASGRRKCKIFEKTGTVLLLQKIHRSLCETSIGTKEEVMHSTGGKSVFDCPRVMRFSIPAESGDRHKQLVILTYALKDDARVNREAARFWAGEVNKMFREPKLDQDVVYIVNSIYG